MKNNNKDKILLKEELILLIEKLERKIKYMKIQTNIFDKNLEEMTEKLSFFKKELFFTELSEEKTN
jgi:hypothetical protein